MTQKSECSIFNIHYEDKRSMAAAYLISVASKALFYEKNGIDHDSALESMKEESYINSCMTNEEITNNFIKRITDISGIKVTKRGRNGSFRNISIRLVDYNNHGIALENNNNLLASSRLIWKSFWKSKKSFSLLNMLITTPHNLNDKIVDKNYSTKNIDRKGDKKSSRSIKQQNTSYSIDESFVNEREIPFLKLENNNRSLEIKFESFSDYDGCLKFFQKCQKIKNID